MAAGSRGGMLRAAGGAGLGGFSGSCPRSTMLSFPSLRPPVVRTGRCPAARMRGWEEWEWVVEEREREEDARENVEERERKSDVMVVLGSCSCDGGWVLGPVPSRAEVEDAVSALQQVIFSVSNSQVYDDGLLSTSERGMANRIIVSNTTLDDGPSSGQLPDWIEPSLNYYYPKMSESEESTGVFDAFHLLRSNPYVQRMVVSLASDDAVWDAVSKNEAVQELHDSLHRVGNVTPSNGPNKNSPDAITWIVEWVLDNLKAKVQEILHKLSTLIDELFRLPYAEQEKKMDAFTETLRSSLMLSVLVLLVIVVTRSYRA
ncbi:hypothetical protein AMTRI_Chr13g116250 [Amborella trichopoda]